VKSTIASAAAAHAKVHADAILKIANNGNITTPNTTTAALYLTTNGAVTGSSTVLASLTKPLRIGAGKSMNLTIPVSQIPSVSAGDYTIVAQMTDPDGQKSTVTVGTITISA
jgi:hypothetical protein